MPPFENILLAQIEHHRTEVFYNLDPVRYPSSFVRKLPGSVKTLCWRAAPSGNADLAASTRYWQFSLDPGILAQQRVPGRIVLPRDRPADGRVWTWRQADRCAFRWRLFAISFRARRILEHVAQLADTFNIVYHLDTSRLTTLAESFVGRLLPLQKHRRPSAIARIAKGPVFGRELYDLIGRSKIVLNGAIDMAGRDRGNMRCFEAFGCGGLLLSDEGNYPEGMRNEETMMTYEDETSCLKQIKLMREGLGQLPSDR